MGPFDWGMYSGYVPIEGTTNNLHYLLVESQRDWETDPLIIWYNGGPGCSSMLAFMQEHGPYELKNGETTFTKNEYSWNKEANVLYIEQPAGVGYSFCDWENHKEDCTFDDNSSATDNLAVILGWFEKYPEYKGHDLYISGESYGGIYVPFATNQVHHHNVVNRENPNVFKPNLKGMMVGNGVTNWKYDTEPAYIEMGYWHSLYDTKTHDSMKEANCDYSGLALGRNATDTCMDLYDKFAADVDKVNVYDIFGYCYGLPTEDGSHKQFAMPGEKGLVKVGNEIKSYKKVFTAADYTPWARGGRLSNGGVGETPPCVYGGPVVEYLNRADVRSDLHIPDEYPAWDMCNSDTFIYNILEIGSQWIWEALKGEVRMIHFSGDVDGAVPTDGTWRWVQELGREVLDEFRPYFVGTEVAGFIEEYDGLTYATVHGAGHMAPQFRPKETYHLIFNWINRTPI